MRRYYIVVFAQRHPICCGIVLLLLAAATLVSGQQPKIEDAGDAAAPLLPLEQAWIVTLPARPAAGGALDADRVYLPLAARLETGSPSAAQGSEQVVAFDRETGERRWARDIESVWPPVVGDGSVFVAGSRQVRALDPATGEERWRAHLARPIASAPAFAGGLILVPMAPDGLLAFRASDGVLAWQQSFAGPAGAMAISVAGDAVYMSLPGSRLVRLAVGDGRIAWDRQLSGQLGAAATARDRVFVGTTDNAMFALDSDDGDIEWIYRVGGDVVGAAADDEIVFMASLDNILRALNRGNGNQRWKAALVTRPRGVPRAFGNLVVIDGLTPALAAFHARTGAAAGTYAAPEELIAPALIDPDLEPFRVAVVAVTSGHAIGLRPVGMMFREAPAAPLTALPGRPLPRESLP